MEMVRNEEITLLTPEEIKNILRLKDKDMVYLLLRSKTIPGGVRIGRLWRIESHVFFNWLRGQIQW